MKTILTYLLIVSAAVVSTHAADSYSTEATLTLRKEKNQYEAVASVARITQRSGAAVEEVIARPRVVSAPGFPGGFYVGLDSKDPNYSKEENVSMEVSWPKTGESGFAFCTVTVKRGDQILSKSKLQVRVDRE